MKKIILPILLFFTGTASYVTGYVYIHMTNELPIIVERDYVMSETITQTKEECFEENEQLYMLYPMYGEVWIYESDGSFYDYTEIMLYDLPQNIQTEILNRRYVVNLEQLFEFLNTYTS